MMYDVSWIKKKPWKHISYSVQYERYYTTGWILLLVERYEMLFTLKKYTHTMTITEENLL